MSDTVKRRKVHTKIVNVQDVLYGSIEFTPLLLKAMDTPYFQRLGRVLQLGMCHYVYPGATHTRKAHCMGASHLAGVWMKHLQRSQEELHITERMVDIVRLAALLHDIGHTFFSHLFDHEIAPLLDIPRRDHEERSVHLLRLIAKEEDLGMTDTEVEMVAAMITGKPPEHRSSAWPDYLFQIVAADIDVDKMDYLRRDSYFTGVPCGFQYDRLINSSKVIDGQLCFNRKVARNILQMFHTRYYFHSEIYQHKTTMIVSAMMSDAIRAALPLLGLEKYFQHDTKWCELDDNSVRTLLLNTPEAKSSHEILARIDRRDFYTKHVTEQTKAKKGTADAESSQMTDVAAASPSRGVKRSKPDEEHKSPSKSSKGKRNPSFASPISAAATAAVEKAALSSGAAVDDSMPLDARKGHGVIVSTVGYLNENVNPLTRLWFFSSDNPTLKFRLDLTQHLTSVVPTNFAELRRIEFDRSSK